MKTKMSAKLSGAGTKLKEAVPRQRDNEDAPPAPEEEPSQDTAKASDAVTSVDIGVTPDAAYRAWANDAGVEIVDESPGERILWRDDEHDLEGAVTFHELAPALTRVMLVIEHRPHSLTGRVARLTRSRTRHARRDLREFQRRVMAGSVLHGEELPSRQAKRGRGKRGSNR